MLIIQPFSLSVIPIFQYSGGARAGILHLFLFASCIAATFNKQQALEEERLKIWRNLNGQNISNLLTILLSIILAMILTRHGQVVKMVIVFNFLLALASWSLILKGISQAPLLSSLNSSTCGKWSLFMELNPVSVGPLSQDASSNDFNHFLLFFRP